MHVQGSIFFSVTASKVLVYNILLTLEKSVFKQCTFCLSCTKA